MPVVRRGLVGKKSILGKKPMSPRAIISSLPSATHEDRERIRMIERSLLGSKGPKTRQAPPTHEQIESMEMLARHLGRMKENNKRVKPLTKEQLSRVLKLRPDQLLKRYKVEKEVAGIDGGGVHHFVTLPNLGLNEARPYIPKILEEKVLKAYFAREEAMGKNKKA